MHDLTVELVKSIISQTLIWLNVQKKVLKSTDGFVIEINLLDSIRNISETNIQIIKASIRFNIIGMPFGLFYLANFSTFLFTRLIMDFISRLNNS